MRLAHATNGTNRNSRRRTMLFLLANRSVLSEFDLQVLQGVETSCSHRGWRVEFASFRYDSTTDLSTVPLPSHLQNSATERAVILCGTNYANLPAALRERGIPFSLLGNGMAEPIGDCRADTVFSDDVQGARDATSHLIAQGHREIFFVGDEDSPWCRRRAHGYRSAMHDAGFEPLLTLGSSGERDLGYQAIKSTLAAGRKITAAVAGNGPIAEGMLEAIEETPSAAISVAGFGSYLRSGKFASASVREFPDELGAILAEFAAARAESPAAAIQHFTIPTELVIQDSLHSLSKGETC